MIVREIEVCPKCGQWNPWRKVSSRTTGGVKRVYVRCFRCGKRETIEYRTTPSLAPRSGAKCALVRPVGAQNAV